MIDRKVKGESVIYIPLGQVFTARDGKNYKPEATPYNRYGCKTCAFKGKTKLCPYYRCVWSDREEGKGVHFVKTKEQET